MLLRALKDLPTSVNTIARGSLFHEHNPVQAQEWLDTGYAELPQRKNKRGWTNGLLWDGCQVAILASGASLSEEQAEAVGRWREVDRGHRKVITINTTFRRALWADLLYACDGPWWEAREKPTGLSYLEEARASFKGDLWTQHEATATKHQLKLIRSQTGKGLCRSPGLVFQGRNSGYQAIGLAYWSGAQEVYLLGYDMHGQRWHGNHPAGINKMNHFPEFLRHFRDLAADVVKLPDFQVINCTPKSALRDFPMRDWREVFA
jgi:hypothetical protein